MDSIVLPLNPVMAQMGSVHQNDPFFWDSETLSRVLCSQSRPWIKNPAALAAKLAGEEVDGYILLTYEYLLSRNELMECLNITTARSKVGLAEAILSLQAASRGFRSWKKNFLKRQSMLLSDDERDGTKDDVSLITPVELCSDAAPTTSTDGMSATHELEEGEEAHSRDDQITIPLDSAPFESDGDYPMQMNGNADETIEGDSANNIESPPPFQTLHTPTPVQHSEEKSSEWRRLAPTNLSAKSLADSDSLAFTRPESFNLVDGVKKPNSDYQPPTKEIPPEYAYLGGKGRDSRIVFSHIDSPDTPWISFSGGGFAVVSSKHMKPPGQRLAVNSMLRKYFLKNSRKEATLKRGLVPLRSSTPSDGSETIIDLDDLPDSWDEETQREIDEEKAEVAARERELARYVPMERVEAILKEEMAAMETKWQETKLPRYQRKAYQFWMDAKRKERIKEKIFGAQREAERYKRRLRKLYAEILDNSWQTEREIRIQAGVMEQSLRDKFYSIWLIALLEKRDPPPKPLGVTKLKSSTAKTPLGLFDDEVLTSSDEDEFIVPDEDHEMVIADKDPFESAPQSPLLQHNREESYALSEVDASMIVDLTQLESPEKLTDSKVARLYIDLTSPRKQRTEEAPPEFIKEEPSSTLNLIGEAPPMDQLGSLDIIGEYPAKHWAKLKDRWRLLLCLLWKLRQVRRERIFRLMQESAAEEVWQASIHLYQTNPFTQESDIGKDETKTVAFDLTKLFLSCTQCRQYTDARIMTLDKKDRNRIKRTKSFFPAFHAFISEWASEFPQSSQIFRTDAFDDEIESDNLDEHPLDTTESQSKTRKHVAKEIVQNREGVDLREREKKRAEEQEVRRAKLRATLATSNTMTQDKSRLIINESKQDDQSFIYVNDEIGKRIKDHQINGVRFLWNQIVLDAEVRQGCLLAHTMGLGKTMQVITFLVAITEAANSDDESIKAQVPRDLRKSQSLILCPAGLVDNWLDEILMWSPKGLLGNLLKVESAQKEEHLRLSTIRDWDRDGGVLVVGHEMFRKTWVAHEEIRQILTQTPNIVICDEAHMMKNPKTQLNRVCRDFRTRSRIALTGSPLSNSVEEYYSMINWVAPKFLGPQEEFNTIYVKPIEHGLGGDSTGYEKRKALKMLEVLKMNVAPKVQRATIQCVRHELPAKYEFVIFVEPTPIQKVLYDLYLKEMAPQLTKMTPILITNQLGLVCNHPRCFRQKMIEKAAPTPSGTAQELGSSRREDEADDESKDQDSPTAFPQSMISTVLKQTNGADNANPTLSQKVVLLLLVLDEARAVGDKVLVFSQSLFTLNYLEELFKQQGRAVCRLDGSTAVSKRQDMIKAFNTGRQEIYLISTKAGGVGLNIFGANRVVIFDFKWNPVTDQQAVGRAYRFGQTKTVYVYRFLVAGTFEEELQNKSVFKLQLASRVVDKKNPVSWGKRNGDLLHPIATKPARDLSPFVGRDRILDKLIEHGRTSGVIRQIVSTDTFEEEDPTNELTAEERRDAEELHDLERLKYTDPEKYRQMWDHKQRADQIRAMAAAAQLNVAPPSTQMPPPNSTQPLSSRPAVAIPGITLHRIATPNTNTAVPLQTQAAAVAPTGSEAQSMPHFPSSAPLPMAGANTFIGKANSGPNERENTQTLAVMPTRPAREPESRLGPGSSMEPALGSTTSTNASPMTTPTRTASLFSQPRSQTKGAFEDELIKLIDGQQEFTGQGAELAAKLTTAIAIAQRKQALGFLPDNARWRLLLRHIKNHPRFMLAIVWGNCTPDYLASAPEEEIQNRISVMNCQSQEDFAAQLRRSANTPDPSNLNNINRPWMQSFRASEDAQVMRRAADKRTERRFRLPPWANNALSENNSQPP
ncbi:P-loop containing nucleoside triphosphate hydrolase protein [Trichoderma ceciliae]